MKIAKTSIIDGVTRTREIDVTQDQLNQWNSGALIQNVMPDLDENDREFIMTGITPEQWEEVFGE